MTQTPSHAEAIQEQMLRLAHVYTGKENGAQVTATPSKNKNEAQLALVVDLSASKLSAEDQQKGVEAIYAKVVGSSVPDETSRNATSLSVKVPDSQRTADRLGNIASDAVVERETAELMRAREAATERLTYILGAEGAQAAMKKIDRKITPRPDTAIEKLASGPMRDYVNEMAPIQGYSSRGKGDGNSR